jgi:hypothetical protein
MTIFHHKLLTLERMVLANEMNSSIIHNNICSFSHKECHPEGYHSDLKYHMTLNIVFSVLSSR